MSDGMTYIGRKPCGCVVAAVVDEPAYRKETAKAVADFIRGGLAVERVTSDLARLALHRCVHEWPDTAENGDLFGPAAPPPVGSGAGQREE